MTKESNVTQIHRFDVKGVFMEIMSSGFKIGKVVLNIAEYDNNYRQTALNTYYFGFAEWFMISNFITSGIWLNKSYMATQHAKQNQSYMQDIFIAMSGTAKEKLRKPRPSGCDESRVFRVFPSMKSPENLMFSIAVGDGQKKDKGIIAPRYSTHLNKSDNNTIVTQIMISYDELRGVCKLVDARIQAYIIAQQIAGAYNYIPNQATDDNKPQQQNLTPTQQPLYEPAQQTYQQPSLQNYQYPQYNASIIPNNQLFADYGKTPMQQINYSQRM
mgnify:CR=1 FL=1